MTEPFYFTPARTLTVGDIVRLTGAEAREGTPLEREIGNIAPIDRAGPQDLTFLDNMRYADKLASTRAGACLLAPRLEKGAPAALAVLRSRDPYRAFVAVMRELYPEAGRPSSLFDAKGVAPGTFVHASARLENGVVVDPGAIIGPRAEIGSGTVIGANAVIGPNVRIGRDCAIGPGATLTHSLVGDGVIIHAGCHIGQDGFGYLQERGAHGKVPQIGRVIIQDCVEIGAGTTIDRGAIRDTVIGEGTKIDNLVQIAHNCEIGRHCVMAAFTGISGSVTVGDYVMMGGRVGLAENITVGAGAMIGATAAVMNDIPPGEKWVGAPAMPAKEFFRGVAAMRKLARRPPGDVKDTDGDDR
jgi:UDP-3-O-[3-hydroxymyristoyl] glucosamine N-acyltransferase